MASDHHHHHVLPFWSSQPRARRGRRFVRAVLRFWTARCFASMLLLSTLLFLAYTSFPGRRLPSHRGYFFNPRLIYGDTAHVDREVIQGTLNVISRLSPNEDARMKVELEMDAYRLKTGTYCNSQLQYAVGRVTPAYLGMNMDLRNVKDESTYRIRGQNSTFVRKHKSPPRKHLPCPVDLLESVNNTVEPKDYLKFTQFSLEYIDEEIPHGNDVFEHKFGGHQTLEERENSFYVRNHTLHCGFVGGSKGYTSTGFDLYDADKEYMHSCKIAVSSCNFGSSDFLRRPTSSKIGAYSKSHVCFVMFLDELTMSQLTSEGNIPDDKGNVGLWRLVLVRNLPYTDMRKTGKVPKFLSHRLFPSARYSIWIDSKMRLDADPLLILEYFLWRKKSEYAISNHYDRHCVWEEVLQNKRLNKYNHTAIDEQFLFYQSDGLVQFDGFDKNIPLPSYVPEGSFIVRAHTPMSNLFSCLWFNEVDRFTSRDQLSFGYTFLKLRRMNPGTKFHLNMFKDCERRRLAKVYHHRGDTPSTPGSLIA